ncbi:MAG: bifunctional endoribonuclease/protein kinase ire1 [Cirrosporium novae-zelandiae]|nr:MAG: bifunctional endoribonuclease/protein kinase ire1 [Cirrosporium novae-zelandiae]
MRRPPGASTALLPTIVTLLITLPFISAAQQQQRLGRHWRSILEDPSRDSSREHLPWTPQVSDNDVEIDPQAKYKHGKDTALTFNNLKDIATLAPAGTAVRAPPSKFNGKPTAGLSPLQNARTLQDWEVEDFILLATVDGKIYARDRKTGAARWALEADKPMVETIYPRHNKSQSTPEDYSAEDDFLWLIEPSKDGKLYILNRGSNGGVQKTGLTVKELAQEMSPYADDEHAVVYTADKKSTLYTVDAATGTILRDFSSKGSSIGEAPSCRRISALEFLEDEECGSTGTITLGRTEYTIGIQRKTDGRQLCTLCYSEWGPNIRDTDLKTQYEETKETMDQKYVYSRYDGSVFGFDHARGGDRRQLYTQKFSSPVARVFDIVRPVNANGEDTSLVLLPQPVGPSDFDGQSYTSIDRDSQVFVNCTESGGWYAMSESAYPLVTGGAPTARYYDNQWPDPKKNEQMFLYEADSAYQKAALVGVHAINNFQAAPPRLAISAPSAVMNQNAPLIEDVPETSLPTLPSHPSTMSFIPGKVYLLFLIIITIIAFSRKDFSRFFSNRNGPTPSATSMLSRNTAGLNMDVINEDAAPQLETVTTVQQTQTLDDEIDQALRHPNTQPIERKTDDKAVDEGTGEGKEDEEVEDGDSVADKGPEKNKRKRGRRGGKKHKKGKANANQVDQLIEDIKGEANTKKVDQLIEEIKSPSSGLKDVSSIQEVGNLRIFSDKVLGFGSNGTTVFEGSLPDNRQVAVKRVQLHHYDIILREVELLTKSDSHMNVVRYFSKVQEGEFAYIALELCPGTLQDLMDGRKPFDQSLLQWYSLHKVDVLKQITAGVRHLHSLKIVHRDLKPNNILVQRTSSNGINALISDFGLCKKLDDDQSSFRATTAHAAGTSGWRAPEILGKKDTTHFSTPKHSDSTLMSDTIITDPLTQRKGTRAIDIFSLGCLFYYVLTNGGHPFDDRNNFGSIMREANIIQNHKDLSDLEVLGDDTYEAKDLIETMVDVNPKSRPDANSVLMHPFFWSADTRLTFLCDVSDGFESEKQEDGFPPPCTLLTLESIAPTILGKYQMDFLRPLPQNFKDNLGRQRKYTPSLVKDLLRALRNKKNHYEDMPESLRAHVGPLPEGYLHFWTVKFPTLLMSCHWVVGECAIKGGWKRRKFEKYFESSL